MNDSKKYLTRSELPEDAVIVTDAHLHSKKAVEACINDFIRFNKNR